MARLRTDDAARRLDFPVGPPLLKAPFPVWGVFCTVTVAGWVIAGLLVSHLAPAAPGPILLAACVPLAPATILALMSKRWINRVTPLLYHLRTLVNEVRAPRPESNEPTAYETCVSVDLFAPSIGSHK
ncbi:hypothetical protein ACPPVT_14360 [Angustibacter sp. McL0619]|uniref:hypothetical protein n=1 Tax=Angustibacter sp. McL0619 TaxID=3415676 RepID=UPI003CECD0D4